MKNLSFFLGKLYRKFFFSYALPTQWLLHTEFSLISRTPWPDQNDLFLKVVIRKIRNFLQISVWNTNFFASQAISKNRFVLNSSNAGDIPYQVCFDLDNSLTRSKRPIFKSRYPRNTKISVWNTNFFPRQAIAKISLFVHSTYTGDSPYQVCFDLDNYLNRWKRPISKIRYWRNSQTSVWKPNFFRWQLIPKIQFFPML